MKGEGKTRSQHGIYRPSWDISGKRRSLLRGKRRERERERERESKGYDCLIANRVSLGHWENLANDISESLSQREAAM